MPKSQPWRIFAVQLRQEMSATKELWHGDTSPIGSQKVSFYHPKAHLSQRKSYPADFQVVIKTMKLPYSWQFFRISF
ncbi:hypothetical protein [Prevotella corporis]|uniref:hypothetical protein n=1 Tax=Prevotella corporis TaxID=28128 RepID=UPI0023F9A46D|nr:hypothetical protein [Prevotella corporis]